MLRAFLLCNFCFGQPTLPEGFISQQVVTGINPVAIDFDPSGRLFITELTGNILLIENDIIHDTPVGIIPVDNTGERGLYGIAFDPDFEFNQYIYLYYSVQNANHNRLSRFKLHDNHIHYEDEETLMNFDFTTAVIHNGGDIKFGPDGKLYIAVGDGGTPALAQSHNSLFGKILRINSDGSVPTDNPFYTTNQGIYKSIYAYGLRNPFTFDFNHNKLFVSDVGQSAYEEINDILPGKNYGWPIVEGPLSGSGVAAPANYMDPVYTYSHAEGCAITGAAFYNPRITTFPEEYKNKYFFGDYCNNTIKAFDPETQITNLFLENGNGPTFIKISEQGEMYVGSFGGGNEGSVWKITYNTDGSPRIAVHPKPIIASVGDTVIFSIIALGDAQLHYQWLENGTPIPDATTSILQLESVALSSNNTIFSCMAKNEKGQITSIGAKLTVTTRTRPEPSIGLSTYNSRSLYIAGDTIIMKGTASDVVQGLLPTSALKWNIDFHHNHHSHPVLTNIQGADSVAFIVPRIGETSSNVWYRILLEAQNEVGLSQSTYTDIYPQLSTITIRTSYDTIAPFPVFLDGAMQMTPFSISAVAGMTRNLSIAANQSVGDYLYTYIDNDKTASSVTFNVPSNDTTISFTGGNPSRLYLGRGQGLLGKYYSNKLFSGLPDTTRIDQHLDFNWGFQPPIGNIPADNYSIIWEGYIRIPTKDLYTFHASFDNGLSLSIDDELLIDKLVDETDPEHSVSKILDEGIHAIKIYYYEASSSARVKLSWESSIILKGVIPQASLYDQYYSPKIILTGIDSFEIDDKLYAQASAKDFEENPIAAERFRWSVDFVKNDIMTTTDTIKSIDALEYDIPQHFNFFDSYFRINIIATDNNGFEAFASKDATPVLSNAYGLKISPNPSKGIFNLHYIGPNSLGEVNVYNYLGKLVLKKDFSGNDAQEISLDLTSAPAGMYLIKTLIGKTFTTKTVVKN